MQSQVDLYTGPHKGQRLRFFTISKSCGTLNVSDQNAITALEGELASFRDNMYLHADIEEKFIHPLLSQRVPGGADRLNEDHRMMHRQFDELVACFGEIKKKPREELSLEFYLAWNRFISFYLNHIDYEEEHVCLHSGNSAPPTNWAMYSRKLWQAKRPRNSWRTSE